MNGFTSRLRSRQQAASAAGIAAGALLLLLLLAFPSIKGLVIDEAGADEATECGSELHFYSADVDNNFNGPSADGNVEEVLEELHNRRCADPALVVEHAHVNQLPGFAELSGDEQLTGKIRELRDNPELWRSTVTLLEDREATANKVDGKVGSIATMSGSYETMYMIDGATDVPLIRKDQPDRPEFKVLRFTYADGTEVNYKLDCGYQPVAQEFPNVPPVNNPPPTNQPPPTVPPCKVNCSPPPCRENCTPTTVCPPPADVPADKWDNVNCKKRNQTFDEQQNESPPVQPPQDNTTSGVNVGPTPGAGAEPPQDGPAPVVQDNTPAPLPTPRGTNSGSSSGSNTPGGSTCNNGVCSGGGPTQGAGTPSSDDTGNHTSDPGGFG